jgi:hypothetical protein
LHADPRRDGRQTDTRALDFVKGVSDPPGHLPVIGVTVSAAHDRGGSLEGATLRPLCRTCRGGTSNAMTCPATPDGIGAAPSAGPQETLSMERRHDTTMRAARYLLGAGMLAVVMLATAQRAAAQDYCAGETFQGCGFVWNDLNNNGVQDAGEPGIAGVKVSFEDALTDVTDVYTDVNGVYQAPLSDGTYTVTINTTSVLTGFIPSPTGAGGNDTMDSDGVDDMTGHSVTTITIEYQIDVFKDFGFHQSVKEQPGTGTPGYWKNHPSAWPVGSIEIGGVSYTKAVAIEWLGKVSKDKTTTMFSSLLSAKLNVIIGNDDSCIASTIDSADAWMAEYGPVGSDVRASTPAWVMGEPLHKLMDSYNNGLACAPHRN